MSPRHKGSDAGVRHATPPARDLQRQRPPRATNRVSWMLSCRSPGTPRPKPSSYECHGRSPGSRVAALRPPSRKSSSGLGWRKTRRLQLRGQPRNSNAHVRHRIPFFRASPRIVSMGLGDRDASGARTATPTAGLYSPAEQPVKCDILDVVL